MVGYADFSRVQKRLVTQIDNKPFSAHTLCGGDKRDRTADLLTASQALSQLSYTPEYSPCGDFRSM